MTYKQQIRLWAIVGVAAPAVSRAVGLLFYAIIFHFSQSTEPSIVVAALMFVVTCTMLFVSPPSFWFGALDGDPTLWDTVQIFVIVTIANTFLYIIVGSIIWWLVNKAWPNIRANVPRIFGRCDNE